MLTPRQQQLLSIIRQWQQDKGFSPSISEMGRQLGTKSRSMVQRMIAMLEEQGYIERVAGVRRNIRLLKNKPYSLPRVGCIAAGSPIPVVPQSEAMDLTQLVADNRFMLEVRGDSMSGDHIQDGDMVICEICERAKSGDIVVVLVRDEEATLKRIQYQDETQTVCLFPSNPEYASKIYFAKDIKVQGRYLGLIRWHKPYG
jgi:repressor LexA